MQYPPFPLIFNNTTRFSIKRRKWKCEKILVRFVQTTTSTASHLTQQSFSTPEWTETISSWYIQSRVVNQFKLAISIDEETRRGWFESVINTGRLFYPTERSDDEIGKGITRIQMTILTDEKGESEGRKRTGSKCKRLDPTRTKIGSRQDTYIPYTARQNAALPVQ